MPILVADTLECYLLSRFSKVSSIAAVALARACQVKLGSGAEGTPARWSRIRRQRYVFSRQGGC